MFSRSLLLAALLCLLAPPTSAEAIPAALVLEAEQATVLRPRARSDGDEAGRRCTADGRVCIALATYSADLCRAIELAADGVGLDPGFFARLLWRESLFDAGAVSPAGAQGIAQFMPATAARRRLADPFNPAEAIRASADYLKELEGRYGNLGLAAAAYNAGEERLESYLAGARTLPGETRAYVVAITGHPADAWRDGPEPEPDLSLDPGTPFREACLARAERRTMPTFEPQLEPWGVFFAGRDSRDAVEFQARGLVEAYPALLRGERIDFTFARLRGTAQSRHFAQVGAATRAEAEALCSRLRAEGAGCMVLRN